MDIMELGAIGELVGGVAVIGSLIYLAVQVRGSAQEQRVSAMREATREMAAVTQSVSNTQERAEIWLQGLSDFGTLGPVQRLRFSAIVGHYMRLIEQLFYQNRSKRVEPEVYDGVVQQLHDFVAYPGFEAWWPPRSRWYGKEFRHFVESHIGAENEPNMFGEADS